MLPCTWLRVQGCWTAVMMVRSSLPRSASSLLLLLPALPADGDEEPDDAGRKTVRYSSCSKG